MRPQAQLWLMSVIVPFVTSKLRSISVFQEARSRGWEVIENIHMQGWAICSTCVAMCAAWWARSRSDGLREREAFAYFFQSSTAMTRQERRPQDCWRRSLWVAENGCLCLAVLVNGQVNPKDGRQRWQAISSLGEDRPTANAGVCLSIFKYSHGLAQLVHDLSCRLPRINPRKQRKVNKPFGEGLSLISRVQVVLYECTLSVTTWGCRSSLVPFVLVSALISLATSAGLERRDRQAPILPFWPFPAIYSESCSPPMEGKVEEKVCVE